jgi:hypothetical protein
MISLRFWSSWSCDAPRFITRQIILFTAVSDRSADPSHVSAATPRGRADTIAGDRSELSFGASRNRSLGGRHSFPPGLLEHSDQGE